MKSTRGRMALGLVLALITLGSGPLMAQTAQKPVKFHSGFEDGALRHGENWNISGNPPEVVSDITRAGRYAMKSVLSRNSKVNFRTEVRSLVPEPAFGEDTWYGFSIYLPPDFVPDPVWEILAQWHDNPDNEQEHGRNPILSIHSGNGHWMVSNLWDQRPTTTRNGKGKWTYGGKREFDLGPYQTGTWTDWVVHVRWSHMDDGVLQIWKNGELVVDVTGPNCFNDRIAPYFKMGIYKGWMTEANQNGAVSQRVVYHDEFRVAGPEGSYEAVAPSEDSGAAARPAAPAKLSIR